MRQGDHAQVHDTKLKGIKVAFEGKVVRPVEAVSLGLQKDTVYWQKGLLSSPPVSSQSFPSYLHKILMRDGDLALCAQQL